VRAAAREPRRAAARTRALSQRFGLTKQRMSGRPQSASVKLSGGVQASDMVEQPDAIGSYNNDDDHDDGVSSLDIEAESWADEADEADDTVPLAMSQPTARTSCAHRASAKAFSMSASTRADAVHETREQRLVAARARRYNAPSVSLADAAVLAAAWREAEAARPPSARDAARVEYEALLAPVLEHNRRCATKLRVPLYQQFCVKGDWLACTMLSAWLRHASKRKSWLGAGGTRWQSRLPASAPLTTRRRRSGSRQHSRAAALSTCRPFAPATPQRSRPRAMRTQALCCHLSTCTSGHVLEGTCTRSCSIVFLSPNIACGSNRRGGMQRR
jgi:hypothetical protein